ncbi:MAG: hypothetical protein ACYS47_16815, partial [Planctomycetota bacterium]
LIGLKLRRGDLEGVDLEIMAGRIHLQLQDEVQCRVKRCVSRRELLTPRAAIGLLRGEKPPFPWRQAIERQKTLPVPALARDPVPPDQAAYRLGAWVDFPIVMDPRLLAGETALPALVFAESDRAEILLSKIENALAARWKPSGGALYLSAQDSLPKDLLDFVASHLTGGTGRARHAAAWGFEILTWKDFGFDPFRLPDDPGNRNAREAMIRWYGSNAGSIRQDDETGRYGMPGDED